jgi:hypothetical protein
MAHINNSSNNKMPNQLGYC